MVLAGKEVCATANIDNVRSKSRRLPWLSDE